MQADGAMQMSGEGERELVRSLDDEPFLALQDVPTSFVHDPRDEGYVCELISRRKSGSGDLGLGVCRMTPGQYHIKHHHPDGSEFYYFYKGECTVHVDGEEVRARPGTAIYLPPNCVHAVLNDSSADVEFVYGLSKPEYSECGHSYDE